jgi:hypothetical protein
MTLRDTVSAYPGRNPNFRPLPSSAEENISGSGGAWLTGQGALTGGFTGVACLQGGRNLVTLTDVRQKNA